MSEFIAKQILRLSFIAFIGVPNCIAQGSNSSISDPTIAAAINTLKTSKIIDDPKSFFGAPHDEYYNHNVWDIYDAQTNAIAVLGEAKIPGTAPLLIPYLNYPTPNYMGLRIYTHPVSGEVPKATAKVWPALEALTKIPGSAQALADYSLDTNNPADFRLAAFFAIKYVDKSKLKETGDALTATFSNSKRARSYIVGIEDENNPFPYMGTRAFFNLNN